MANTKQAPAYPARVRQKLYFLVDKTGKTVKEVCEGYFISKKTYYKWKAVDLGKRDYVPKKEHPQTKLKGEIKIFVCEEKKRINYGPRKMDAKYVWQNNVRKYQRTFIDIFTGFHHAVICETLTSNETITAFEEAERVFPFPIFGVQSDNGSENRGEFHQYLGRRGLAHYFIPKSSPTWDGAVERAHGVIDQEFYLNLNRPWKTLSEYLLWHNYDRIHLGKYLNGLTPIEKFNDYQLKASPLKVN